jgi:hypothetical protein
MHRTSSAPTVHFNESAHCVDADSAWCTQAGYAANVNHARARPAAARVKRVMRRDRNTAH